MSAVRAAFGALALTSRSTTQPSTSTYITVRHAATMTKRKEPRKSNNVERAIRVKRMSRAAEDKGRVGPREKAWGGMPSSGEQPREEKRRYAPSSNRAPYQPIRFKKLQELYDSGKKIHGSRYGTEDRTKTPSSRLRQAKYKTVEQLSGLMHDRNIDASMAYVKAQVIVDALPPIMRRESRIYNYLIRHALRAGRKSKAFKVVQDMKKNGCSLTMETFKAVFTNLARAPAGTQVEVAQYNQASKLYIDMTNMWKEAQKPREQTDEEQPKEHIKKADAIRIRKELEKGGVRTFDPDSPFRTGRAYHSSRVAALEEMLGQPQDFCLACESYLSFLLKHKKKDEARKLLESSYPLSRVTVRHALPQLQSQLAQRVLQYYTDVKSAAKANGGKHPQGTFREDDDLELKAMAKDILREAKGGPRREQRVPPSMYGSDRPLDSPPAVA